MDPLLHAPTKHEYVLTLKFQTYSIRVRLAELRPLVGGLQECATSMQDVWILALQFSSGVKVGQRGDSKHACPIPIMIAQETLFWG